MDMKSEVISCTKEEIFDKFYKCLCHYTNLVYLKNYDKDDLIQEGYTAVLYAYRKYNPKINNNFYFYGKKSIVNRYFGLVRKCSKNNYEVSIHTDNKHCQNIINEKSLEYDLEEDAIENINEDVLKSAILKLQKKEKDLVKYVYFKNMTLTQYSKFRNMPYSTCINLNKKTKDKLKEYLVNQNYLYGNN